VEIRELDVSGMSTSLNVEPAAGPGPATASSSTLCQSRSGLSSVDADTGGQSAQRFESAVVECALLSL